MEVYTIFYALPNSGKPKNTIVSIQFLAQCINSIMNSDPAVSRSSPGSLTKKDTMYNKIFNNKRPLIVFLNCLEITKKSEKYMEKLESEGIGNQIKLYFKFHLARILASVLCGKVFLGNSDLEKIDAGIITDKDISSAFFLLHKAVENIAKEDKNLITISKSQNINLEINNVLKEFYEKKIKV